MVYEKTELFLNKLQKQFLEQKYAEMRVNYLAMTTDTLCCHTFDQSMSLLDSEIRAKEWHSTIRAIAILTPLVKQFTWIIPLALRIPLVLLRFVVPVLARIVVLRKVKDSEIQCPKPFTNTR